MDSLEQERKEREFKYDIFSGFLFELGEIHEMLIVSIWTRNMVGQRPQGDLHLFGGLRAGRRHDRAVLHLRLQRHRLQRRGAAAFGAAGQLAGRTALCRRRIPAGGSGLDTGAGTFSAN